MADSGFSPELALVDRALRDDLVRALPPIELDRPVRVLRAPSAATEGAHASLPLAAFAYTIRTIAEFAVVASVAVATVTIVVLVLAVAG